MTRSGTVRISGAIFDPAVIGPGMHDERIVLGQPDILGSGKRHLNIPEADGKMFLLFTLSLNPELMMI